MKLPTPPSPGTLEPVAQDNVEIVESFTYLGVGYSEHAAAWLPQVVISGTVPFLSPIPIK